MFDDELATVWSAPNYCYRCGNMASILTIRANGERDFTVYGPAEENERDAGMQTRRMVRARLVLQRVVMLTGSIGQHAILCLGRSSESVISDLYDKHM